MKKITKLTEFLKMSLISEMAQVEFSLQNFWAEFDWIRGLIFILNDCN